MENEIKQIKQFSSVPVNYFQEFIVELSLSLYIYIYIIYIYIYIYI